jgi:hypothetical protein
MERVGIAIWSILELFGIFYGHLVYFSVLVPILYREKSASSGLRQKVDIFCTL